MTGFDRADPSVSLLIDGLMIGTGSGLVKASARIFLEAAGPPPVRPEGVDRDAIGRALGRQRGLVEVHDLHPWDVTSGFPALSAHVLVAREGDCHAARRAMDALPNDQFQIQHTTLQVDHQGTDLLDIEPLEPHRSGATGD